MRVCKPDSLDPDFAPLIRATLSTSCSPSAFDYAGEGAARAAALKQCKGDCTTLIMKRACAALSVDMANPCGAHGYAVKSKNIELAQCRDQKVLRVRRQGMRDPRLGLRRQGLSVTS